MTYLEARSLARSLRSIKGKVSIVEEPREYYLLARFEGQGEDYRISKVNHFSEFILWAMAHGVFPK